MTETESTINSTINESGQIEIPIPNQPNPQPERTVPKREDNSNDKSQYEERLAEKDMVIMQKDLKIINYELNDYYRKKKSLEDQLQSLNDNIIKKEAEKSNLENQLNN